MYVSHQLINSVGIPNGLCCLDPGKECLFERQQRREEWRLERWRREHSTWNYFTDRCHDLEFSCIRTKQPIWHYNLSIFSLFGHLFREQISSYFSSRFFYSSDFLRHPFPCCVRLHLDWMFCIQHPNIFDDVFLTLWYFSASFEKWLSWRANVSLMLSIRFRQQFL